MKICHETNETHLNVDHSSSKIRVVSIFFAFITCLITSYISASQCPPSVLDIEEKRLAETNPEIENYLPEPYFKIRETIVSGTKNHTQPSYRLNQSYFDFLKSGSPVFPALISGNNNAEAGGKNSAFDNRTQFPYTEGQICEGNHRSALRKPASSPSCLCSRMHYLRIFCQSKKIFLKKRLL